MKYTHLFYPAEQHAELPDVHHGLGAHGARPGRVLDGFLQPAVC